MNIQFYLQFGTIFRYDSNRAWAGNIPGGHCICLDVYYHPFERDQAVLVSIDDTGKIFQHIFFISSSMAREPEQSILLSS